MEDNYEPQPTETSQNGNPQTEDESRPEPVAGSDEGAHRADTDTQTHPSNSESAPTEDAPEAEKIPESSGNSNGKSLPPKMESFIEGARKTKEWVSDHIPGVLYAAFWGTLKFIGKIIRTIVFGDDRAVDHAARSFERAMEAEELKSRHEQAQQEARTDAKESTQEAKTVQTPPQQGADPIKQDPYRVAKETITARNFRIHEDSELESIGVLRLTRTAKDGEEKECFVPIDILKSTDKKTIYSVLKDAANTASAQRYLEQKGLVLSAVGENAFIVQRPDGASFAFDKGKLEKDLENVVKTFERQERKHPNNHAEITSDMTVPLTATTVAAMLEKKREKDAQEAAERTRQEVEKNSSGPEETESPPNPKISEESTETLEEKSQNHNQSHDAPPEPTESPSDPYQGLTKLGYSIAISPEDPTMVVASKTDTQYRFAAKEHCLSQPDVFDAIFSAMKETKVAPNTVYESPSGVADVINTELTELLDTCGLVMLANTSGDTIHVFSAQEPGNSLTTADTGHSWTLSQSVLAAGDATELAKIIFEKNNPALHAMKSFTPEDSTVPGIVAKEVEAAVIAVGIVSEMRLLGNGLENDATSAFAHIVTGAGEDIIRGEVKFDPESSDQFNISYGGQTAIYCEATPDTLSRASYWMAQSLEPTDDPYHIVCDYRRDFASTVDNMIGSQMIATAQNEAGEHYSFDRNEHSKQPSADKEEQGEEEYVFCNDEQEDEPEL